ncbi:ATP synthase F0 subunit B [Candidatus Kaiserbacteria bacterium RIFCSPHIGHO2_02_FULL_54_11b]|uniref:ATP synthase subunit b n=2 Tax=Candidatus Kaiseribacteriota TaxID=1752734 RepID=A0A1F6CJS0_9BACT|nr:MAG: ATP synthase F0 subunit B [Candidatus Kaiserbacteria bacterium RIFCSPHIGHO2_01_FULL_54_36b]OGG64825.1 MAG: ATP synthase F0 subunit B [Candidatus Kaiserbacteria bacterium RIFCSPHIGHO2_02_FULL_54_11b]
MSELFAAFGINWQLLLVQALNFGVLLYALWYFLYTPLLKLIDDRQKKIAEGVKTAEAAEKKLADAKVKSEGIVGGAAREAEAMLASARSSADVKGAEIQKAAEARAAATLKEASERAEEGKRQALKESEREIARAAMLAAEKILREKSA